MRQYPELAEFMVKKALLEENKFLKTYDCASSKWPKSKSVSLTYSSTNLNI